MWLSCQRVGVGVRNIPRPELSGAGYRTTLNTLSPSRSAPRRPWVNTSSCIVGRVRIAGSCLGFVACPKSRLNSFAESGRREKPSLSSMPGHDDAGEERAANFPRSSIRTVLAWQDWFTQLRPVRVQSTCEANVKSGVFWIWFSNA